MGWWSESIMGGDGPLDCLGYIGDAIGLEYDFDALPDDYRENTFFGYRFTREILESEWKSLLAIDDRIGDGVFAQVVAAAFLWAGAKMPDIIKVRAINRAMEELLGLKDAGWKSPDSRTASLLEFIEKVEAHWQGGERVELSYVSLGDKLGG